MTYKLLINGALVEGFATIDVINPATEEVIERAPRASHGQLDEAVAAARVAFPTWSARTSEERGAKLLAMAEAMERRTDEFVRTLTAEQGKPTHEARLEIGAAVGTLKAFSAMAMPPEVLSDTESELVILQRHALGVVGAILPWNFPVLLLMNKLGPALMAGNCVVAKPAPTTPLTTLLFGEIAADILPAGVLNIITDANDLGHELASHPGIDKVSFTGSSATGRNVMASVAPTIKRLTLELGGNDAAIVLDDADIEAVAPQIFAAATLNAGQVCLAAKRIYVPSHMYDALCDRLAEMARNAIVDDGSLQGTSIGPLQNRQQYEKVRAYLEDARENGAIVAGGQALDRKGYFIAPTVVRDIGDDASVVSEEQFGPIMPVLAYDNIDEVIERANASEYGLGGTVWTRNIERGIEVASRINTGTVWINKWLDLPVGILFSGAKQSGLGSDSLHEYTQTRVVNAAKS